MEYINTNTNTFVGVLNKFLLCLWNCINLGGGGGKQRLPDKNIYTH